MTRTDRIILDASEARCSPENRCALENSCKRFLASLPISGAKMLSAGMPSSGYRTLSPGVYEQVYCTHYIPTSQRVAAPAPQPIKKALKGIA